jgi:hypothetical protein
MDFKYSSADEAVRMELRGWLEAIRQLSVPALGPLSD